jgi:peptide/nickel transport system permease protein
VWVVGRVNEDSPGLAIALTVFGISLFGDALRDAIDPKLRDR